MSTTESKKKWESPTEWVIEFLKKEMDEQGAYEIGGDGGLQVYNEIFEILEGAR